MENVKEILKKRIKKEWGIDISNISLEIIIQDEQRMKMFKEMGYV